MSEFAGKILRVLMVDSETSWRGGEAQMLLLMRGLIAEGIEVELAAPGNSEIARRTREFDFPVHRVSIDGGLDVLSAGRLRRLGRNHPPGCYPPRDDSEPRREVHL